jgi:hypothetical protein
MKKYELEVDIVNATGKELWSTKAKNKEEAIEKLRNGECDKEVLEMESETDEIDFNEIQEV